MNAIWMSGRRRSGYLAGVLAVIGLALLLWSPDAQWLQAAGRPTLGHEELKCEACHVSAPGTFRQQVQAGVRYLLGMRASPVTIGKAPVDDARCEQCHERPDDRHPLSVLSGTQFAGAQAQHGVHHCTGCHREHHGARVTASPTVCSNCHRDIEVKKDPLQPSHAALFAADRWETCLQCHDFHGNHDLRSGEYDCAASMDEAFDVAAVRRYLLDGPRVYGASLTPATEGK